MDHIIFIILGLIFAIAGIGLIIKSIKFTDKDMPKKGRVIMIFMGIMFIAMGLFIVVSITKQIN